MAATAIAGMVFEAWKDLDRATDGLSSEDAERRVDAASPISWTAGHLAGMTDSFINVRFQEMAPHPAISREVFRIGVAGDPIDWNDVLVAVSEVRERARPYLDRLTEEDLARTVPYTGSIVALRPHGLGLRYALIRIALHHYTHLGEVVAARSSLGHDVGDYPGLLEECL